MHVSPMACRLRLHIHLPNPYAGTQWRGRQGKVKVKVVIVIMVVAAIVVPVCERTSELHVGKARIESMSLNGKETEGRMNRNQVM